jgi:chromosome segregation ATPase
MRFVLMVLISLLLGAIVGFGYDHYLMEGRRLAENQEQLNSDSANLAKVTDASQVSKKEADALQFKIQELTTARDDLQHQVDQLKAADAAAAAAPPPPASANSLAASVEMNQMASSLQLSDTQKDQVYNALYQVLQTAQDPNWVKANTSATDPTALEAAQAKAKVDALSKILSTAQIMTYQQQLQSNAQKSATQNSTPAATDNGALTPELAPATSQNSVTAPLPMTAPVSNP